VEISKTEQIRDVDDEEDKTPAPPPRVGISKQKNNEQNSDKGQQRYPRRMATSFDESYSKVKLQGCARLPKYGSYIH
jgi:hypothetical protein